MTTDTAIWRSLLWKDLRSARYPLGFLFLWHFLWAVKWFGAWAWRLPDGGLYDTLSWVERYRLQVSVGALAVASASLFLADRRRSPTAFWRTRPPAVLRIAGSKLIILGLVGGVWPAVSTFAAFALTGLELPRAAALSMGTFFVHAFIATLLAGLAWLAGSWSRLGLILLAFVVVGFLPFVQHSQARVSQILIRPFTLLLSFGWGSMSAPSWTFVFFYIPPWIASVWLSLSLILQTCWIRKWPAVVCLILTGPACELGTSITRRNASSWEQLATALGAAPWSVSVARIEEDRVAPTYVLKPENLPPPGHGFLTTADGTRPLEGMSARWRMASAPQRAEHAAAVVSQAAKFSGRWVTDHPFGHSQIGSNSWLNYRVPAEPQTRIRGDFISQWTKFEVVDQGIVSEHPLCLQTGRARVRLEVAPESEGPASTIRVEFWLASTADDLNLNQLRLPPSNEIVLAIVQPTEGWGYVAEVGGYASRSSATSSEGRHRALFELREMVTFSSESGVSGFTHKSLHALGATVYLLEAIPAGPAELCTFDLPVPESAAATPK
jgi:hypothetical protein